MSKITIWAATVLVLAIVISIAKPVFAKTSQGILAGLNYNRTIPKDYSTKAKEESPVNAISFSIGYKEVENRVLKLEKYLNSRNSPMANSAADFVEIADKYNLDWKLLPAIAGVESGYGVATPGNFNPFGWNNALTGFANWRESIETVASGLRTNYIREGEITPSKIGPKYAPPSPFWASRVERFMAEIDKTVLE
ncbi:MAG: glucosaminidase domain-containing protein [Patescibacteria group bacterium]|nr:glucosaminidase domain-containing protein [Patescibacteria group bacterium]